MSKRPRKTKDALSETDRVMASVCVSSFASAVSVPAITCHRTRVGIVQRHTLRKQIQETALLGVQHVRSGHRTRPEIKHKKAQSQYILYQEGGFLYLILGRSTCAG
eukprot:1713219-Rhodomonas_salina.2